MQNRFVLSGIPSFVPTLSQSIHSIRDVVEENSCWVDRIAFLPTTTTANTVECCIELHLENVRDCAIASLNDQILVMNRIDGTLVEEKNIKKKKKNNNNKKKNIIWFQIKAYPSTIEQSERLLELCPTLENDNCNEDNDDNNNEIDSKKSKPLIQTVSFPHGIHLTISRTITTNNGIMKRQCGGTGAEAWRGGYLLALQISFWLSSSSSSSSSHDAPINNQQQYQQKVSKSDWWWLQLFHSKTNVLELGAGLAGLPSMILAKAKEKMNNPTIMKHDFPKTITASDGVDEIVSLLKYNVHYNQLGSFLNVQHLDWNYVHNGTDRNSPNHDDNTNIERYDTILFADCIYTDRGAKLLARAIRTLIVPGGNVIGVLPDFRVGLNLFHNQMIQNGFSPTKLEMNNDDKEDGYSSKLICSGNSGKHYTMFWWRDCKNI